MSIPKAATSFRCIPLPFLSLNLYLFLRLGFHLLGYRSIVGNRTYNYPFGSQMDFLRLWLVPLGPQSDQEFSKLRHILLTSRVGLKTDQPGGKKFKFLINLRFSWYLFLFLHTSFIKKLRYKFRQGIEYQTYFFFFTAISFKFAIRNFFTYFFHYYLVNRVCSHICNTFWELFPSWNVLLLILSIKGFDKKIKMRD